MIRIKSNVTPRLPNEYQEVEYIESTGTQYIDTGVAPTNKTNIKLDIDFISGESDKWIPLIAERTKTSASSGWKAMFGIWINSSTKEIALNYVTTDTSAIAGTNGDGRHSYSNLENEFYLDNTLISTLSTSSFTSALNLYVFALNELLIGSTNIETRNCTAKLYELKIYDDSTLIRDFIPCYRKSDNEVGLYDLANNQFYINAGTGVFLMGEAVGMTDANLMPMIGNKKVLKRYIGENLVYQKNRDTFFTFCPFPTSWTEVTAGTKYKATNEYGEWKCTATSFFSTNGANRAFDQNNATVFTSADLSSDSAITSIEIDCPNVIKIKPTSLYVYISQIKTATIKGLNENNEWEQIGTISRTGTKTEHTLNVSTDKYFSKFKIEMTRYGSSNRRQSVYEFQIKSGTLRKES